MLNTLSPATVTSGYRLEITVPIGWTLDIDNYLPQSDMERIR